MEGSTNHETCPACRGEGRHICPDEWYTDERGVNRLLSGGPVTCGRCEGEGTIPPEVAR